jgi:hypothetical protein
VSPFGVEGCAGVAQMETRADAVTLKTAAGLVRPPEAAVMLVEPVASVEAKPELLMVATAAFEETQVAELVRLVVLPSV